MNQKAILAIALSFILFCTILPSVTSLSLKDVTDIESEGIFGISVSTRGLFGVVTVFVDEDTFENPTIEVTMKNGLLGLKRSIKTSTFPMTRLFVKPSFGCHVEADLVDEDYYAQASCVGFSFGTILIIKTQ